MANIPSHMKIRSDLAIAPRTPRSSMFLLISIGVAIGLASAAIALMTGLVG
jgi:hypothetical protein